MELKVKKLNEGAVLPSKATEGSACYDVFSTSQKFLGPGEVYPFGTGLAFEVPLGYELEIRPRSGLASKGITLINSPGTLDSDYRGELLILLTNYGGGWINIARGDRIAQVKLNPVIEVEFEEVEELTVTERGTQGVGSTGR